MARNLSSLVDPQPKLQKTGTSQDDSQSHPPEINIKMSDIIIKPIIGESRFKLSETPVASPTEHSCKSPTARLRQLEAISEV